jgi:predicted transcriptional regulator
MSKYNIYAPLILVACCRIKNDTTFVEGEELEDATLNDINLIKPRQPIFEQAISRIGNGIRDNYLVIGREI